MWHDRCHVVSAVSAVSGADQGAVHLRGDATGDGSQKRPEHDVIRRFFFVKLQTFQPSFYIFLHLSTSYGHWRHLTILTWKTEFCWLRNDMQLVLVNVWESYFLVASGCFIRSLHCLCLLRSAKCIRLLLLANWQTIRNHNIHHSALRKSGGREIRKRCSMKFAQVTAALNQYH